MQKLMALRASELNQVREFKRIAMSWGGKLPNGYTVTLPIEDSLRRMGQVGILCSMVTDIFMRNLAHFNKLVEERRDRPTELLYETGYWAQDFLECRLSATLNSVDSRAMELVREQGDVEGFLFAFCTFSLAVESSNPADEMPIRRTESGFEDGSLPACLRSNASLHGSSGFLAPVFTKTSPSLPQSHFDGGLYRSVGSEIRRFGQMNSDESSDAFKVMTGAARAFEKLSEGDWAGVHVEMERIRELCEPLED
jgi:hypothetical protein